MQTNLIGKISKEVYRRFPEFSGIEPQVAENSPTGNVVLSFRLQRRTSDGKTINRWVRATANSDGKIIRISTSR